MSAAEEAPRKVADVQDLVGALELRNVRFRQIAATRTDETPEGVDPDSTGAFDIQVMVNWPDLHTFSQRFRLTMTHPQAIYDITVQTDYSADEDLETEPAVSAEFIERVAIMAAFPYLREAVSTAAARLEVPVPVLGLLKAGQFKLAAESVDASNEP